MKHSIDDIKITLPLHTAVYLDYPTMKKWLEDLRSDKFQQGKRFLYDHISGRFCCMGVLGLQSNCKADLEGRVYLSIPQNNVWLAGPRVSVFLRQEAKISGTCWLAHGKLNHGNRLQNLIGSLNDLYNFNFKQIADIIERDLTPQ